MNSMSQVNAFLFWGFLALYTYFLKNTFYKLHESRKRSYSFLKFYFILLSPHCCSCLMLEVPQVYSELGRPALRFFVSHTWNYVQHTLEVDSLRTPEQFKAIIVFSVLLFWLFFFSLCRTVYLEFFFFLAYCQFILTMQIKEPSNISKAHIKGLNWLLIFIWVL